jgi:hypothetical protein
MENNDANEQREKWKLCYDHLIKFSVRHFEDQTTKEEIMKSYDFVGYIEPKVFFMSLLDGMFEMLAVEDYRALAEAFVNMMFAKATRKNPVVPF